MPKGAKSAQYMPWVYAALFVTFFALAGLFILLADRMVRAGIARPVFFLVLIPVGLGSAAFLDKALGASAAAWDIKSALFGKVRVAGPVAVFAMVVAGGVFVASSDPDPPLAVVVRLLTPGPPPAPITSGRVLLYLGGDSFSVDISPVGEAVFRAIPGSLRQADLRLVALVPGYEAPDAGPTRLPSGGVVTLMLRPVKPRSLMTGTVLGLDQQPLAGALVDFENGLAKAQTDDLGHFRAELAVAPGTSVLVMVAFGGKVGHQGYYTTPNELTLQFKR